MKKGINERHFFDTMNKVLISVDIDFLFLQWVILDRVDYLFDSIK